MMRAFFEKIPLSFLEKFCKSAVGVIAVMLDESLCVSMCNQQFGKLFSGRKHVTGVQFNHLLLPESQGLFPLPPGEQMCCRLNFAVDRRSSETVECMMLNTNGIHIVLGSHATLTHSDIVTKLSLLNNELANMTRERDREKRALEEAQAKIRVLQGIIPICMYCKKIRDEQGIWDRLERYIESHSEGVFSHGICPDCLETHLAKRESRKPKKKQSTHESK